MKITEEVKKRFDAAYKQKSTPWVEEDIPVFVQRFAQQVKTEFVSPILLDLGCGNGWLSTYLAQQGIKVEGIDSSKEAIKQAQDKARYGGIDSVHFQVGDALDFPYEASNFDAVFDRGLLHHQPKSEWNRYLHGLLRVLKDRGLFYLEVFSDKSNRHGFSPNKEGRMWRRVKDDRSGYWTYDRYFNQDLIERIFGRPFKIIKVEEDNEPSPDGSLLLHCVLKRH